MFSLSRVVTVSFVEKNRKMVTLVYAVKEIMVFEKNQKWRKILSNIEEIITMLTQTYLMSP